jgi:hypothetical protein
MAAQRGRRDQYLPVIGLILASFFMVSFGPVP